MARIARVVVPGLAYHVTHRGNRRQNVFLDPEDRRLYKQWLLEYSKRYDLEIWSYCLMTNHVHHLVVGRRSDSLALGMGRTHGRFAQWQNRRNGWSGHLWANRYYSTPLDAEHVWAAVRYIEQNPVRAGLVERAELYEWSSARSHATGLPDPLLSPSRPFPGDVKSWSDWLADDPNPEKLEAVRKNTWSGRPTGSDDFVRELEARLQRDLKAPQMGRRSGKVVPVPTFSTFLAQTRVARPLKRRTGSPASREAARSTSSSATQSFSPSGSTSICCTRQVEPSSAGST
jgi:REP-associated tyrosine transposase